MKRSKNRQNSLGLIVMGLLLALAIPATALGQGRGRGQWRRQDGNTGWPTRTTSWSKYQKKCEKFRNCHDASGGRWDGRGPRGSRVSNILTTRARRNRYFDNNDLILRNRRNREVRNNFLRYRERRVRRVYDNR